MHFAVLVASRLKGWVKSRPPLDIEESATWFLLLFIYAHGLTTDDLGIRWSGVFLEITAPQLSLAMVLLCLTLSVVILIEPVMPYPIWRRTKDARHSTPGQYLRRMGVLIAFALALTSGFGFLFDKVPTLSWLITSVICVGFAIFVLLGISFAFLVLTNRTTTRPS